MMVAPFCTGQFTVGAAVRAGMLLPGGSEPPVVGVKPPIRAIKPLSALGTLARPLMSEMFWYFVTECGAMMVLATMRSGVLSENDVAVPLVPKNVWGPNSA